MFRMGDFYELFFDDAITAADALDIAVTSRDKGAEHPVPMAGVPYHAIGGYLRTLVERGFKVAICEQMETPEQARQRKGPKIVHREVVRVVTPGVLVDEEHLQREEPNYLAAVVAEAGSAAGAGFGVAALDVSCGEFVALGCGERADVVAALSRLAPREIVADATLHPWLREALGPTCPRLEVGTGATPVLLTRVAHLRAEAGGPSLGACEAEAAATALNYAEATQPGHTLLVHRLRHHDASQRLLLDDTSLRNLEVFRTLRDNHRRGSLLWAVDATRTAMGARLLREWLGAPLCYLGAIHERHEAVAALLAAPQVRGNLQTNLREVKDITRLAARARLGTISPRELGALRQSLAALPGLYTQLSAVASASPLLQLGDDLLADIHAALVANLVDDPPPHTRDGGFIRPGADAELDRQHALRDGGREALAAIERRERERTGIGNLRVQHNRVFGYYIEVLKSQLARVPVDYVRKQTTANAERYVTSELAEHEAAVLGAQTAALEREQILFASLRDVVSAAGERLCVVGEALARLDVLAGLAEIAETHNYIRPEMTSEPVLEVEEGRHPVVERMLGGGKFVPNTVALQALSGTSELGRFLVVTGPNMGGKSTAMRMVAQIAILAQAGSFVPAVRAKVGLVDRVFTRVGAADDLGRGDSTFMVEMRETAAILGHATARSLVLLDEVGRGTATFDGLALAWAITEYLHDQVGCRTLFATHYHELTALADRLPGLRNVHVAVHEDRGAIVFLHRIEAGAAERSYGIQVGRLAGLPASVLRRAQRLLTRLEADRGEVSQLDLFAKPLADDPGQDRRIHEAVLADLQALHPDELSPRAAHETLRRLHERLTQAAPTVTEHLHS